jgi:metallo-beta-lactamase family protein
LSCQIAAGSVHSLLQHKEQMKIQFIGATESVTGSKHLVVTEKGKQVLLDCGLFQGMGKETAPLNAQLGLDPTKIEAVLLSHGHIDHSGNLPYLVKSGFSGRIYCTPATRDVCEILLLDSARIQEHDVAYINEKRKEKGLKPIKPLYTTRHVEICMRRFKTVPLNTEFRLNDELAFHFTDAGHIIGAAAIHLTAQENGKTTRLSYTGDVGRYHDLLLNPPAPFAQADYIICESTYGNKLHATALDAEPELARLVQYTCLEKKGRLIIPSFSLGRTQEIVYVLERLRNKKLLPGIGVYVDSPLSSKATEVVRKHTECYNPQVKEYLRADPEPFSFHGLSYIENVEDSKALNAHDEPCIILSASGMADAGRIKHHIKHAVGDAKNTILIVGYCSPRSLGSDLEQGNPQVHIFGEVFDVKAEVRTLYAFSAHADYRELLRYLSCQDAARVKKVFLVHGEAEGKSELRQRLLDEGYAGVVIPEKGEVFELP